MGYECQSDIDVTENWIQASALLAKIKFSRGLIFDESYI